MEIAPFRAGVAADDRRASRTRRRAEAVGASAQRRSREFEDRLNDWDAQCVANVTSRPMRKGQPHSMWMVAPGFARRVIALPQLIEFQSGDTSGIRGANDDRRIESR